MLIIVDVRRRNAVSKWTKDWSETNVFYQIGTETFRSDPLVPRLAARWPLYRL
jgi:hypothetical protein